MGTTSLIIGLIVFIVALFPNLGYFILIPAVVGLIIGVCKVVRDGYCPWGISGIILNGFAMLIALFWTGLISMTTSEMMEEAVREIQERPEVLQVFYPVVPPQHSAGKIIKEQQPQQTAKTAVPAKEMPKKAN